jgi:hypothetical protein
MRPASSHASRRSIRRQKSLLDRNFKSTEAGAKRCAGTLAKAARRRRFEKDFIRLRVFCIACSAR